MENNEAIVKIVTNKTYFVEDSISISFKFNNKVNIHNLLLIKHLNIKYAIFFSLKLCKQKHSDWIALYKCGNNMKLEEFIAVEPDLTTHSPNKHGFNSVKFYANQLKDVKCNLEYEFIYGNAYNEVSKFSQTIYICSYILLIFLYRFME